MTTEVKAIPTYSGKDWVIYNDDCVHAVAQLPSQSVGIGLFSLPFANLYIYSDSEADMGNAKNDAEFFQHYGYLMPELYRVMIPGRVCVVHCKDLPKYANRDDTAGLKDFPGDIIDAHEAVGFSFHSRVTIWKCPVVERERTNNNGLLHATAERDRSQLRQGMADYLLVFRKPPNGKLMSDAPVLKDNDEYGVVTHAGGFSSYIGMVDPSDQSTHPSPYCRKTKGRDRSVDIWRRYAEPAWWDLTHLTPPQFRAAQTLHQAGWSHGEIASVLGFGDTDAIWFEIDQRDVLNYRGVRKDDPGERHICPLQMGVIERAIQTWSEPGDVVLSPFAGIGSELMGAIRLGRKAIGVELKKSYCDQARLHLETYESGKKNKTLFDDEE